MTREKHIIKMFSASVTVGEKFLVRTIRICSILRRSVLEPRPNGLTARNERSI